MTDRSPYPSGTAVRTKNVDPPHHTRLPRYGRGRHGVVIAHGGMHALADVSAQGGHDVPDEQVYAVRFTAMELWGGGDHDVVIDLWESYLEKSNP
jgi:hypothetical protein